VSIKDDEGNPIKGTDGKVVYEDKKDVNGDVIYRINEWGAVGEWMWDNRHTFNGISALPYNAESYIQAPFEDCSEEKYKEMAKSLHRIDLTKVIEIEDNTDLSGELACSGGACEVDVDMKSLSNPSGETV